MAIRLAMMMALFAAPVLAQDGPPSGQAVTLYDLVLEPETSTARFRYLAPQIAPGGLDHAAVAADFEWLCIHQALPELAAEGWSVNAVVISLSDREVPLGVMDPEATQYFEGFRIENNRCIWEPF